MDDSWGLRGDWVLTKHGLGVCKEEKAKRDECMLMNEDGEKACQPIIQEYKKCMKGFGFDI